MALLLKYWKLMYFNYIFFIVNELQNEETSNKKRKKKKEEMVLQLPTLAFNHKATKLHRNTLQ